jgi:hypothetical protein
MPHEEIFMTNAPAPGMFLWKKFPTEVMTTNAR